MVYTYPYNAAYGNAYANYYGGYQTPNYYGNAYYGYQNPAASPWYQQPQQPSYDYYQPQAPQIQQPPPAPEPEPTRNLADLFGPGGMQSFEPPPPQPEPKKGGFWKKAVTGVLGALGVLWIANHLGLKFLSPGGKSAPQPQDTGPKPHDILEDTKNGGDVFAFKLPEGAELNNYLHTIQNAEGKDEKFFIGDAQNNALAKTEVKGPEAGNGEGSAAPSGDGQNQPATGNGQNTSSPPAGS